MNNPIIAFLHEIWLRFFEKSPKWAVIIQWVSGLLIVSLTATYTTNAEILNSIILLKVIIKGVVFFKLSFGALIKAVIFFLTGVFGTAMLPNKNNDEFVKKLSKKSPTAKERRQ